MFFTFAKLCSDAREKFPVRMGDLSNLVLLEELQWRAKSDYVAWDMWDATVVLSRLTNLRKLRTDHCFSFSAETKAWRAATNLTELTVWEHFSHWGPDFTVLTKLEAIGIQTFFEPTAKVLSHFSRLQRLECGTCWLQHLKLLPHLTALTALSFEDVESTKHHAKLLALRHLRVFQWEHEHVNFFKLGFETLSWPVPFLTTLSRLPLFSLTLHPTWRGAQSALQPLRDRRCSILFRAGTYDLIY